MKLTIDKQSTVERIYSNFEHNIGREISEKEKKAVEKLSENEINNLTGLNIHSKETYG